MPVSLIASQLLSSGGGSGGGAGSGITQGISGLVSGITGLIQKHKANQLLAQTKRPTYAIPGEILQNQKQAELNANTGLPSEQYQQAMQNVSRQQNSALQRANDRRGGLLAVAGTQQAGNDATLKLDVANANARLNNQRTLYGVNNQVATYKDKAFNINEMQPYQQNYNYAMNLLGSGNQNLLGGVDKLAAGAGRLYGSGGGRTPSSTDNSSYEVTNSVGPGGPIVF